MASATCELVEKSKFEFELLTDVRGLWRSRLDREMEAKTLRWGEYRSFPGQLLPHRINQHCCRRGQATLLRQRVPPVVPDLIGYDRERSRGSGDA